MNADVHPTPADQIAIWNYEADVVIAEYGIAGAAAAVGAASAGADVLVLERTGGWGGAAALASASSISAAAPHSNEPAASTIPSTT